MGDVKQGELEAAAQVVEQAEYLQPDRDVQHGHRLVGEQHARPRGERPGERDPLPLAAGQLVGEFGQERPGGREPHLLEQCRDLAGRLVGRPGTPVQLHRPFQVIAHGVYGIQRGERVLEDELHLALVLPEGPAARQLDRLAVQPDRAAGEVFLPGEQPGDRRLARAALADQCDHGPAVQPETDPPDRVQHLAAAKPEILVQGHRLHGQGPPLARHRDDPVPRRLASHRLLPGARPLIIRDARPNPANRASNRTFPVIRAMRRRRFMWRPPFRRGAGARWGAGALLGGGCAWGAGERGCRGLRTGRR